MKWRKEGEEVMGGEGMDEENEEGNGRRGEQ